MKIASQQIQLALHYQLPELSQAETRAILQRALSPGYDGGSDCKRLNHPEMAPGDPCPESGCEGHLHQLEQPNVKIYLKGQR